MLVLHAGSPQLAWWTVAALRHIPGVLCRFGSSASSSGGGGGAAAAATAARPARAQLPCTALCPLWPPQQLRHQQWPWHPLGGGPWRRLSSASSGSASSGSASSGSASSGSGGGGGGGGAAPKNVKGELPRNGPSAKALTALPFSVSRAAAAAAFGAYHEGHWYQSRQKPVLAKPFREAFLPFWVGSGAVRVEVRGAEVGHEHLVTRHDTASGRAQPRWETVWSRVQLHLVWERQLSPEEPDLQLYASWKYSRPDVEVLRPGPAIKLARSITPDMLQASSGSGQTSRRVGPFTVEPRVAQRLLMTAIEAEERKRAEGEIQRLMGAQQVRFIDLHCTFMGSTGAATQQQASAAASGRGGLDLHPVYVPAFVFSFWHGGTKVRTFVSGVNAAAVSGVQVLDDTKLATLAATTTTGLGLLLGAPPPVLLWAGLVVPFVVTGVVARFWPVLRTTALAWKERLQRRWRAGANDFCEVDFDAAFVQRYTAREAARRSAGEREGFWQAHGHGPFAGAAPDPREFFGQFMRDPFWFFEQHFARQQQQQQFRAGAGQQSYRQQQRAGGQWQQQQQQSGPFGGGAPGASRGSSRDPLGYYEQLGLQPGCSTQEVQSAFRGLALAHHPDRFSDAADKARETKRFQAITEAYQVLRDTKKRQAYDAGVYQG